jgi:hypothetical protein
MGKICYWKRWTGMMFYIYRSAAAVIMLMLTQPINNTMLLYRHGEISNNLIGFWRQYYVFPPPLLCRSNSDNPAINSSKETLHGG